MLRACVRTVSMPIESALRDLGVRAPVLKQLEHLGLARGQLGALELQPLGSAARGGRARQHVHPARREVDRVHDVARLGLLREAAGGAEREHLGALGRRWAGSPAPRCACRGTRGGAEHVRRAPQHAEVEQHDVRASARRWPRISPTGTSLATRSRLGSSSIRTESPIETRSSNSALLELRVRHLTRVTHPRCNLGRRTAESGGGQLRDLALHVLGARPRACSSRAPSARGPSARPTICGRCSTGMPRSRSTNCCAAGCCRSRFRWQSGQGVTRQSAPASIASARWRPACRSEVVRFIVMTGKPQHLRAPAYSTASPPEHLDQLFEVLVALRVLVEAEPLRRAHDVAAVEGRDPQPG